jgi:enoyl-CoA hydratase
VSGIYQGEDVAASVVDGVVTLALTRPKVNAMRTRTWTEFGEALSEAAGASNVLVIRSGVDGIFSAGADVKELPMPPAQDEHRQRLTRDVLAVLGRYPVPVIAAVDGAAVGGACALLAQADIRVGTARARFAIPEIDVGRCGGTRHLAQHLDPGTVRWMAFTGAWLHADAAHARGLLTLLVDDLDTAVAELAERIAAKSPTALRLTKQAILESAPLDTDSGYALEQRYSLELARSSDAAEAAAAFADKRTPNWSTA